MAAAKCLGAAPGAPASTQPERQPKHRVELLLLMQPKVSSPPSAELAAASTCASSTQSPSSEASASSSALNSPPSGASTPPSGKLWLSHKVWPERHSAHRASDVRLLSEFLELSQVPDISGDAVRLLLRMIKMLRYLRVPTEDLCSVLAHASAYFPGVFAERGSRMSGDEVGRVLIVHVYIAHTWVLDQTSPLAVWHRNLFEGYCRPRTLRSAVFSLLELRGFKLRVEEDELSCRYEALMRALA